MDVSGAINTQSIPQPSGLQFYKKHHPHPTTDSRSFGAYLSAQQNKKVAQPEQPIASPQNNSVSDAIQSKAQEGKATIDSQKSTIIPQSFTEQTAPAKELGAKNIATTPEIGTDLALKEKAREVEKMLYSVLWGIVFNTAGVDGSNSEGVNALKLLAPELLTQIVSEGMKEEELGDIANSIYKDLQRVKQEGSVGKDVKVSESRS